VRRIRLLVIIALLVGPATALRGGPEDAVVRQPSHGASCTVIWTGPGKTYLLGCAHAYTDRSEQPSLEARTRRIVLDLPWPKGRLADNPGARARLAKIDYELDLSLVELPAGPAPYVCPVAPAGHRAGRLLSVGYDEMKWPHTVRYATPVPGDNHWETTYTRERPWHGRSGGALIDVDAGVLVGVVQGYEVDWKRRGMYVSLAAIRSFLGWEQASRPPGPDLTIPFSRPPEHPLPLLPKRPCPG